MTANTESASASRGSLHTHPDDPTREVADLPSPCVQAHAANLMVLHDGTLGCVWFGGSMEGRSDISVYMSRLEPGSTQWTAPVRLSDDPERSEQNPILFPAPDGSLWLLHTAQVSGNQDTSVVRRRVSHDNGRTWGPTETLQGRAGRHLRPAPDPRPQRRKLAAADLQLPHAPRREVGRQPGRKRRHALDRPGQVVAAHPGAGQPRLRPHEHRPGREQSLARVLPQSLGRLHLPNGQRRRRPHVGASRCRRSCRTTTRRSRRCGWPTDDSQ